MPVETFGSIAELNPSFPAPSDGLVQGDDHIRGIKAAVKATFPNISGPLNSTQTALDAAATAIANGVSDLAFSAHYKAHPGDGFVNSAKGVITVYGTDATDISLPIATFTATDKSLKVLGPLQAVGAITGPGSVPIGGSIKWYSNSLPSDIGWAWENGQKISAAANPVLAALWADRLTDGGTKILLPDSREVVPVGNSTMGGTAARGLITNFSSTLLTTIGGWFGEALHALTGAENGPHIHGVFLHEDPHTHTVPGGGGATQQGANGSPVIAAVASSQQTTTSVKTNISVRDTADAGGVAQGTANQTASAGLGTAHNNVQPSAVVNWIVRIG